MFLFMFFPLCLFCLAFLPTYLQLHHFFPLCTSFFPFFLSVSFPIFPISIRIFHSFRVSSLSLCLSLYYLLILIILSLFLPCLPLFNCSHLILSFSFFFFVSFFLYPRVSPSISLVHIFNFRFPVILFPCLFCSLSNSIVS